MALPEVIIEFPNGVVRNGSITIDGVKMSGVFSIAVDATDIGKMAKVTLGIYTSRLIVRGDMDVLARFVEPGEPLSDDTTVSDRFRHYVAKEPGEPLPDGYRRIIKEPA